jgi:putative ABC transport system ATP-binding protein
MAGVSYSYGSHEEGSAALRGVDLVLGAGEWVAVMGASGSGKTTLLLCAAGLLPACEGRVVLSGVDLGRASERELTALRRQRVGFVFQEYNLVPALTVAQNVELPGRFAGRRPPRSMVRDALDRVGLAEKAGALPDELSGGQRQRVAIARALVAGPAVVFADEPTGALDSRSGDRVLKEFASLASVGSAVLMVTHDPRVAARANQVIWLRDGQIVDHAAAASAAQIAARLADLEELPS